MSSGVAVDAGADVGVDVDVVDIVDVVDVSDVVDVVVVVVVVVLILSWDLLKRVCIWLHTTSEIQFSSLLLLPFPSLLPVSAVAVVCVVSAVSTDSVLCPFLL